MIRLTTLFVALVVASAARADVDVPEAAYAKVNAALVRHHIAPRFEHLATAAADFDAAIACDDGVARDRAALRPSYDAVMDAWMAVRHIRFGPVRLFMRNYRLYFWPEARGKIAGAVDEILAADDPARFEDDRFASASVAVQGLPAVEVLLFADRKSGPNDCALLRAIAGNMRAIADDTAAGWREADELGPTPSDAALTLFRDLHDSLQLIAAVKLKPVLAKPRLAESGLSGRSVRNIAVNLEALQAMYLGEGGAGLGKIVREHGQDATLDPLMRRAFAQTIATARSIDVPIATAVADPVQRAKLDKLTTEVLALKQIVRTRLAAALGLAVGFNALDGD